VNKYPGFDIEVEEGYERGSVEVNLRHIECRWGFNETLPSWDTVDNFIEELEFTIADHNFRYHNPENPFHNVGLNKKEWKNEREGS